MSAPNPKTSTESLLLQSLYYTYKDFLTPLFVIGVCLLTLWFVILPQIQNWFSMQSQISADTQQLAVLKQNLNAITVLNDASLDDLLTLATKALPTDKDIASIVAALDSAALQAGTQIGDYTFQIGTISGVDPNAPAGSSQNSLQLVVTVPGNLMTIKNFVANLKKELPISDVHSVTLNANNTISVTVVFYYAPLPRIAFDDTAPLQVVSGKDQTFLESLGSVPSLVPAVASVASPSAQ